MSLGEHVTRDNQIINQAYLTRLIVIRKSIFTNAIGTLVLRKTCNCIDQFSAMRKNHLSFNGRGSFPYGHQNA